MFLGESLRLFFKGLGIGVDLFCGYYRLFKIKKPIVTVFGGKRFADESIYVKQAYDFGKKLHAAGFSLLTGGGPGTMNGVNCGMASCDISLSSGIGVDGVNEDFRSDCMGLFFRVRTFFVRKYLLIYYSKAFVVFPGGFGTLEEVFEVADLIKTNKLARVPVILVGSDYWHHLINMLQKAVHSGAILKEYADIITVEDDLDIIIKKIKDLCEKL
ncbi:MAG: hypothetical protein UR26_C0001G0199 [candidate division TM6 bacterium GW2011_GWF2_32_72]|nr:MAG: hypothetical protein UR26_C0001G0199 [candidate division TM6 bacterium GW2011_GWF2_32_72]